MGFDINNIKPCFWGKKFWGTIFSMVAVYPNNPSKEYIKSVKYFFLSLKETLPCTSCRESYTIFISEQETNITNDALFTSRDKFINFVYKLRNKVNHKIGLEYNITKEYFKMKLDKMCCVDGNDVDGYINELSEAPFIQETIRDEIYEYLKQNKSYIKSYNPNYTSVLIEKNLNFIKKANFNIDDKNFKLWFKRNLKCRELINKIYNNMSCGDYGMIDSFFKDKQLHLQLFYMGCSIIPLDDLQYIFNSLEQTNS
jgi:hypothetical protein